MAAKVQWMREAWWVITHYEGRRKKKRIGPNKKDKARAEKIAAQIDAALALGTFRPAQENEKAIPIDVHLREWHKRYGSTFKASYEQTSSGLIENHLAPFFGGRDLRELREEHLLDYVRAKLDANQRPATVHNALSIVRRVCNLAVRDGLLTRNPASRLGEIMRRVDRREATEVRQAEAWTETEVRTLLAVAHEHEIRFYPALLFMLSTGVRRGECLGVQWSDIDFERCRVTIRRAIVRGAATTPKNGKSRTIAMPPGLASALFDRSHNAARSRSAGAGLRSLGGFSARSRSTWRGRSRKSAWVAADRSTNAISSARGSASVGVRKSRACDR